MGRSADFKKLEPVDKNDPNERIQFLCTRCKKPIFASDLDSHASRVHHLGMMVTDNKLHKRKDV